MVSIFGLTDAVALDDDPATLRGVEDWRAELWTPGLGLFRDGVLRVPGRETVGATGPGRRVRPDRVQLLRVHRASSRDDWWSTRRTLRRRPLGYAIWPEGLGRVLDRLHAVLPGTPLLVAEYGIGTDDDDQRAAYLPRGLELVQEALARGIDVRGFFHWTAVDNYEWFHGFEPTAAFGLIDRDRNVRASAEVLGREACGANG